MLRFAALLLIYGAFAGAGAGYYMYTVVAADLPGDLLGELDQREAGATVVYSADGVPIGEFYLQKRLRVPYDRIPEHVRNAFIAAEDRRFWEHPGYDWIGIARAAWANYTGGGIKQGASTITQQVTRMLMLGRERTYSRKAKELILSVRVERELSKQEILHKYLENVYLGRGAYGVQAAAEIYFGKDVSQLTVAEAAMIAGLPKAPGRDAPHLSWKRARGRQRYVLSRMVEEGYVTPAEADAAWNEPIALVDADRPLNRVAAPYFVEHIRLWATDRYGASSVFAGGLRIYTTLDTRIQRAAESAVRSGLEELDRDLGFRGPLGHLDGDRLIAFAEGPPRPYSRYVDEGALSGHGDLFEQVPYLGAVMEVRANGVIVVDVGPRALPLDRDDARAVLRWRGERGERIQRGDLVPVRLARDPKGEPALALAQRPDVQAALVALEPATAKVRAMVGGYDYTESQYNRATQAMRPSGSAFKPIIYAAALERGFTHLSVLVDGRIAIPTASGTWSPTNFKGEFEGPVTLRTALAKSLNSVSVRLLLAIGLDPAIDMMRRLGITAKPPRTWTLSLGTDLKPIELIAAFAAFPAGGKRVDPRFVELVSTDDGVIIEDFRRRGRPSVQVVSPQLAYLMCELMKGVVERGTARKVSKELDRPAAGKTGTSNDFRDAWFIGYTADFLAGVWVGRDDFQPIGDNITGGRAALPIWLRFMKSAHPDVPVRDFEVPPDILLVRANEYTGRPLPPGAPGARLVPFMRGTVPAQFTAAVEATSFKGSAAFKQKQAKAKQPRR